jgi:hypothetical protein
VSQLAARLDRQDRDTLAPAAAQALAAITLGARTYPPIGEAVATARLERLTGAGAWTEAALALVALVLPSWQVRRLELDGGEWWCTLSRYPRAPREFDDAVDGRDPLLPLAILDALFEARQRVTDPMQGGQRADATGDHSDDKDEVVWCDNTF